MVCRPPATELPVLVALAVAFVSEERGVLLTGVFATLFLATVWWPGDEFLDAMRRRLQPLSADREPDELLTATDGRLRLRTR